MQISSSQVDIVRNAVRKTGRRAQEQPVRSVEELAAKHGVKMEEVRRFTESAMMAEEDPARARRVEDLERRIAEGAYQVEAEDLLNMAERRAIADRAADL
jgi:anti-sigma28 factor (negative regulator of flagellin synthesis)